MTTTNEQHKGDIEQPQSCASAETTPAAASTKRQYLIAIIAIALLTVAASLGIVVYSLTKPSHVSVNVEIEFPSETFMAETKVVIKNESAMSDNIESSSVFELEWNGAFSKAAFPVRPANLVSNSAPTYRRALGDTSKPALSFSGVRRLAASQEELADGSLWSLTRDTGPGLLYTEMSAEEGPRWHVAWQLDAEQIIVHRTHVRGFVYTYVTDVPLAGLHSTSSWAGLDKRHCDMEPRYSKYTTPGMPTTGEELLEQAGKGDAQRQSMLGVEVGTIVTHAAQEDLFVGCDSPGVTELEEVETDGDSELDDEEARRTVAEWLQSLIMSMNSTVPTAPNASKDLSGSTYETGLAALQVQLWPRDSGSQRAHSCATYSFLNPIACDVIAPPSWVVASARRRLSNGEADRHTVSEGEMVQMMLELAGASPQLATRLYGADPAVFEQAMNNPAYVEHLLTEFDRDGDGTITLSELDEAEVADVATAASARQLAVTDGSSTGSSRALVQKRELFIFSAIAAAIAAAIKFAAWVAKMALIAAKAAAAAAKAAAAAAAKAKASVAAWSTIKKVKVAVGVAKIGAQSIGIAQGNKPGNGRVMAAKYGMATARRVHSIGVKAFG